MEPCGTDLPAGVRRIRKLLTLAGWATPLTYLVLLGGTPVGELNGWVQAANGILAMGLIAVWLRRAPRNADGLDAAIIVALLFFLTSAVLSLLPRQSFFAAIQATALAAGFYLARRELIGEARVTVQVVLGWICLFVVGVTLAAWVGTWVAWLQAADWSEAPPLTIWLPAGAFDNRHYVATLVLLLVPALWSEMFRQRWAILTIAGTTGAVGIVLMDASRTLVVAAIAASFTVAAMHARTIAERFRGRILVLVIATSAVLLAGAVMMAPLILERITNLPKLMARFAFFWNGIDVWLDHPLAGVGPGVYPFSYFVNDYFANVNYAPRHPDNAATQLLVEAGLLGIAAGAIVLIAIAAAARRRWRGNAAATWALVMFLVACIGTNPTDFLFLLVPALIWAAMLVPASRESRLTFLSRRHSPRWNRLMLLLAMPVAAATLLTSVGSVAYQVGGDRYRAGDAVGATRALDIAVTVDPGHAFYWRERGSLLLASGSPQEGRASFEQALRLVPWDPGAMRGVAVARLAAGDPDAALAAASAAFRIQPHSAANAIVVAVAALEAGEPGTSATAVSIALLEAPYLGFVPWSDTILRNVDVRLALAAAARAVSGYRAGEYGIGLVLVVLMAGAGDASAAAASGGTYSGRALAAVAECDKSAAQREIRLAGDTEREFDYFWISSTLVREAFPRIEVSGPGSAARYIGLPDSPGPSTSSLLADGVDDVLRYRRASLDVSTPMIVMPNAASGRWLLINDPAEAMSRVVRWPPDCDSVATSSRSSSGL